MKAALVLASAVVAMPGYDDPSSYTFGGSAGGHGSGFPYAKKSDAYDTYAATSPSKGPSYGGSDSYPQKYDTKDAYQYPSKPSYGSNDVYPTDSKKPSYGGYGTDPVDTKKPSYGSSDDYPTYVDDKVSKDYDKSYDPYGDKGNDYPADKDDYDYHDVIADNYNKDSKTTYPSKSDVVNSKYDPDTYNDYYPDSTKSKAYDPYDTSKYIVCEYYDSQDYYSGNKGELDCVVAYKSSPDVYNTKSGKNVKIPYGSADCKTTDSYKTDADYTYPTCDKNGKCDTYPSNQSGYYPDGNDKYPYDSYDKNDKTDYSCSDGYDGYTSKDCSKVYPDAYDKNVTSYPKDKKVYPDTSKKYDPYVNDYKPYDSTNSYTPKDEDCEDGKTNNYDVYPDNYDSYTPKDKEDDYVYPDNYDPYKSVTKPYDVKDTYGTNGEDCDDKKSYDVVSDYPVKSKGDVKDVYSDKYNAGDYKPKAKEVYKSSY